jgi:hypothetical protein
MTTAISSNHCQSCQGFNKQGGPLVYKTAYLTLNTQQPLQSKYVFHQIYLVAAI